MAHGVVLSTVVAIVSSCSREEQETQVIVLVIVSFFIIIIIGRRRRRQQQGLGMGMRALPLSSSAAKIGSNRKKGQGESAPKIG
jgi:hypothetical protein